MVDEQTIDQAVAVIALLANRNRLGIMAQLRNGELRAVDLQRRMGMTQPLIAYHMRVLTAAGWLCSQRSQDRRTVYYTVNPDGWIAAVGAIRAIFAAPS